MPLGMGRVCFLGSRDSLDLKLASVTEHAESHGLEITGIGPACSNNTVPGQVEMLHILYFIPFNSESEGCSHIVATLDVAGYTGANDGEGRFRKQVKVLAGNTGGDNDKVRSRKQVNVLVGYAGANDGKVRFRKQMKVPAGYAGDVDLEGRFRKQVMVLTVTLARSLLPPEQRRARLKGSPRSVEENSFSLPEVKCSQVYEHLTVLNNVNILKPFSSLALIVLLALRLMQGPFE